MSFSEGLARFGDRSERRRRSDSVDRERIRLVFNVTGSVNQAAKAVGVSHPTARRVLVAAGLVDAVKAKRGKPEAKRRFLALIEAGWSTARAAGEVGVNVRTARDWLDGVRRTASGGRIRADGTVVDYHGGERYAGVVPEVNNVAPPAVIGDRFLSLPDRLAIADGLLVGRSITEIATRIGKHKSTVSREVRAHRVEGLYLPHQAHQQAWIARARPRRSKLVGNHALRKVVETGLSNKHSPEQISQRLRKDFPDDEGMRVSHETIYQALYFQARGGLKREVQQALRTGRAQRRPRRSAGRRTHRVLGEMIMISDRPAEVEDRALPGNWEGDLITGQRNRTAIATLVERTTRYTMLVHLPSGHDAASVRDALIDTVSTLPAHLRGSLTWDQGTEMAKHQQFSIATDMTVYFCDPASPWQRGTNENTYWFKMIHAGGLRREVLGGAVG